MEIYTKHLTLPMPYTPLRKCGISANICYLDITLINVNMIVDIIFTNN